MYERIACQSKWDAKAEIMERTEKQKATENILLRFRVVSDPLTDAGTFKIFASS